MTPNLKAVKKLLPENETVALLLSTLLITVGVYFAFPERETLATLPLMYLFALGAFLFKPSFVFQTGATFAVALFYGKMGNLSFFLLYAAFCAVSALAAALTVWSVRRLMRKKYVYLAVALPLVALGILLPVLFAGTPASRGEAEEKVADYLKTKYPDQEFQELLVYFDPEERGYTVTAFYDFKGNLMDSPLFLRDGEVRDGFLDAFCGWMQEERKSVLISVLKKSGESFYTDAEPITTDTEDMVFRGSYGSIREETYPLMNFTVTFREEKPDRETFSEACREAVILLREAGFSYGTVTFRGLDAGRVALVCRVTPQTLPEDVSGLCRYEK